MNNGKRNSVHGLKVFRGSKYEWSQDARENEIFFKNEKLGRRPRMQPTPPPFTPTLVYFLCNLTSSLSACLATPASLASFLIFKQLETLVLQGHQWTERLPRMSHTHTPFHLQVFAPISFLWRSLTPSPYLKLLLSPYRHWILLSLLFLFYRVLITFSL